MIFINFDESVILNKNGIDFCCNINRISKSEAENLLENAVLIEKSGTL